MVEYSTVPGDIQCTVFSGFLRPGVDLPKSLHGQEGGFCMRSCSSAGSLKTRKYGSLIVDWNLEVPRVELASS